MVKGMSLNRLWMVQVLVELAFEYAQRNKAQFCKVQYA